MKNRMLHCVAALTFVVALPLNLDAADLKIRFEYAGEQKDPALLVVNKDESFCGKHQLASERLVVNSKNKGVKDVVVYVYTGRGGSKIDKVPPVNAKHVLANDQCRFDPHIVIAQTGDTLEITNPDPIGHNANMSFLENDPLNILIPAGGSKTVNLEKQEPAPIPVDCNIHPWMRAYVVVLEHPFAAASDANGELVIKGLPENQKLIFRVYHEAGRIDDVKIGGKKQRWSRSRFEYEIQPGENDMGTVVIPAEALSYD
ncbi:hypothetical protein CA13_46090 [Planctomycetes bacterium CA13]|uniref:Methylamine utilization protein n=1 Tax=Novipirellula herctigrandis TaxID=2527986 RepID=A0A5C5Z7V4_9BACT|nr:hypothetical protein CA13_46090 [Planctomycetes bacterium CA13]